MPRQARLSPALRSQVHWQLRNSRSQADARTVLDERGVVGSCDAHHAAGEEHMVDAVQATAPHGRSPVNSVQRRKRRRQWLPYVLLIPAIVMELLIHIIPMLIGVLMSFFKMTQLYLANWRHAPFAGLDNYRLALNFNAPAGQALLHSFAVTLLFTGLVLVFSWFLGLVAAILTQRPFRGRGLVSYTHLRAHETGRNLVCRLLLEK